MAGGGEKAKSTIVIKRVKKAAHGHHGGAWKIAYADFVTAMMAFFLLMWLLGSTTKGDLKGIAEYFQSPLQVAMSGGSGAGDATSVINGGGQDLTQQAGQVKRGDLESNRKRNGGLDEMERKKLVQLKAALDRAIEANPRLNEFRKQVITTITPDGLRVQIVDDFNRPMFDLGGASVKPYMREILNEIGRVLNDVDNRIALTGHTDSSPYQHGERGYSNWELSTERANASRRELVAGGMDADKVVRVVGLADTSHLMKEDPRNPLNRRISIIVLNHEAEERLRKAADGLETRVGELDDGAPAGGEPAADDPSAHGATGGTAGGSPRGEAEPAGGAAAAAAEAPAAAPTAQGRRTR